MPRRERPAGPQGTLRSRSPRRRAAPGRAWAAPRMMARKSLRIVVTFALVSTFAFAATRSRIGVNAALTACRTDNLVAEECAATQADELDRPCSLRRGTPSSLLLPRREGSGAPTGAGTERRARGPSRDRAGLPGEGDLPASDVGRRASRRSTAAFFGPGPRFIRPAHRSASASSSRPARNGRRAVPRAARVLGCEFRCLTWRIVVNCCFSNAFHVF